jgi:hypothetical protein
MANTIRKTTNLPRALKPGHAASILSTSFPSPLMKGPWKQALSGHDFVPAAYRVVYTQHMGGSAEWAVGNVALEPLGGASQDFPLSSVWRTVARTRFQLGPGCALQLRVVAVRSGPTEKENTVLYFEDTKGGSVRVSLAYENLASDTDAATAQVFLSASNETDAWEPTGAGESWGFLLFKCVALVHPSNAINTPSEQQKWSESTTVTATFDQEGGARVIHATLSELPRQHVALHSLEEVSVHGWPASDAPPDQRPQRETKDGATYEDHRYGPLRSLQASDRQRARCGPIIASWGAYTEALAEVTDTDTDPISVTSTSFVGLSIGSSITTWSTNNPGHDVAGHYCRPAPENLEFRLDGAASIPVRGWVYARFTAGGNTGEVKFQSTSRSWFTVPIAAGTSYAWHTITGWLECTAAADDQLPVLHDFVKVTGGTMEIRAWALEYGEGSVAS